MQLKQISLEDVNTAVKIIDMAKQHLKEQGIDQWQNGYPDYECIKNDARNNTGFFAIEDDTIYGYLCIDFSGEPAYDNLAGEWLSDEKYVVVHRLAMADEARGKNLSSKILKLVEELALQKGVNYIRVDTDEDNLKMQHLLKKNNFVYRGTIWFDNSEKIAFDKRIN